MADLLRPSDEAIAAGIQAAWLSMSARERALLGPEPSVWPSDVWHQILMSISPLYRYENRDDTNGISNHRLSTRLAIGVASDFVPMAYVVRRDAI